MVNPSTALVGGLGQLRCRDANVLVDRLRRAVDDKVFAATPGVPEMVLGDRIAVRVAGGEQRGGRETLPPARGDAGTGRRYCRRRVDGRCRGSDADGSPAV